jgi:S-formylglutathione hydrolase FrmB
MVKHLGLALFIFLFTTSFLHASRVETVYVKSLAMNKNIPTLIISPNNTKIKCFSVYLLHGYGCDESSWITIHSKLKDISDKQNIIFICPNGKGNWYVDSPVDPNSKYETFISQELINYVDKNYNTVATKNSRAITGFSMGGYGALWVSLHHPDIFGAAGSTSGALDLVELAKFSIPIDVSLNKDFNISSIFGNNKNLWKEYSLINFINNINNLEIVIIFDCGYDDVLAFKANEEFHKKLLKKKFPHDYIVRTGQHDVTYWDNAISYQILFFIKFFENKNNDFKNQYTI